MSPLAPRICGITEFLARRVAVQAPGRIGGILWLQAIVLIVAQAVVAEPAAAQFFFFQKYYAPHVVKRAPQPAVRRQHRPDQTAALVSRKIAPKPAVTAKPKSDEPDRPLIAVISIEDQHVSVYGAGGLIERSGISTGMEGHPTPTGVFAVIQKERWHESNLYSGAPMPFMQRITWSGVAMHQGQLPGYPASHGCIRLGASFAERWFHMTRLGLRVIIAPSDIEPLPFAHPDLPVPRTWAAPADMSSAERQPVQSAALSFDQLAEIAAPRQVELNPVAYAAAEKLKAKAELKEAERAEGEAGDALEAANRSLKEATKVQHEAQRQLAAAEDRLGAFGYFGHRPPAPRAGYGDDLMAALDAYEHARSESAEAARTLESAQLAADAAAEVDRRTDARTEALKERIVEMGRRQETVSVFISRKEGRLYVRQALRPVFDVPVTIRNPEDPLGTHVYVAAAPGPGEKALRWTAYTMPIERLGKATPVAYRRTAGEDDQPSIGSAVATETAAGALARIGMPGEVKDRIAELVWAGASIIISDHGLSPETGLGTDFVVETRH